MEPRKVIAFGNSSYVISLPKKWINQHSLRKGQIVYLDNIGTDLILTPSLKETTKNIRGTTIDISGKTKNDIRRDIVAAYLGNNNNIKIIGEDLSSYSAHIREVLSQLIALEIIQESSSSIIIKDFLDVNTVSIVSTLKKSDMIIKTMFYDLKQNLTKNTNNYTNIIARDKDMNKLNYLLLKTLRNAADNPEMQRKQQIRASKIVDISLINNHLESVGDDLKRIARYLESLGKKKKLETKFVTDVLRILDILENFYKNTTRAFFKQDINLAYQIATTRNYVSEETKNFLRRYRTQEDLMYNTNHFLNIIDHTREILRLAYNK